MVASLSASESEAADEEAEVTTGSPTAEVAGAPGFADVKREGVKLAYRLAAPGA